MKTDFLWQAAIAIVGALASAYAGYWVGKRPDELQRIEYTQSSQDSLKDVFGLTEGMRLTYKGVDQTDLSRVSVLVANTSRKNAEKVRFYFEVADKSRRPLITDYKVPNWYSKSMVRSLPAENGIYIYEFDYMNRSSFFAGFYFDFYFSGPKPPEIKVTAAAKDFYLGKVGEQKTDLVEDVADTISRIWWVVLLYLCASFGLVHWLRIWRATPKQAGSPEPEA